MPVHPLLLHGPSVVGLVTLAEEVPPSSSSPFALPLTLHLLSCLAAFFFLFFPFTINLHAQALLDFFFFFSLLTA